MDVILGFVDLWTCCKSGCAFLGRLKMIIDHLRITMLRTAYSMILYDKLSRDSMQARLCHVHSTKLGDVQSRQLFTNHWPK